LPRLVSACIKHLFATIFAHRMSDIYAGFEAPGDSHKYLAFRANASARHNTAQTPAETQNT
jgi:hypothetical protein